MNVPLHLAHTRGGTSANVIFGILALGLCGLCTFQFKSLADMREKIEKMSIEKGAVTAEREAALREGQAWKAEVTLLNDKLVHSESIQKTNALTLSILAQQLKAVSSMTNQISKMAAQRDEWKKVFEEQRQITVQATEATKRLKEDADAKIAEASKIAGDNAKIANKYAADYKELADAFEKFRAQAQAQAKPSK